jgi:hypothetical protein
MRAATGWSARAKVSPIPSGDQDLLVEELVEPLTGDLLGDGGEQEVPGVAERRLGVVDEVGDVGQHRHVEGEHPVAGEAPDDVRGERLARRADQERGVGGHRLAGRTGGAVATQVHRPAVLNDGNGDAGDPKCLRATGDPRVHTGGGRFVDLCRGHRTYERPE